MRTQIRIGSLLAVLALLVGLSVLPSIADPTVCWEIGNFEEGFGDDGVGLGWEGFDNCGEEEKCTASFHDDTWAPVVYDGEHSQLIEINTFCRGASTPNRYAGIYRTISLTPEFTSYYTFCMHGLLRSLPGDPDPASSGYTVQVGLDQAGGTDWEALSVEDWTDVPWDIVHPRTAPPGIDPDLTRHEKMDSFCMDVTSESDSLTIFIRLWKKWPTNNREVLLNLDGITWEGP
jgi:hypothetical protein